MSDEGGGAMGTDVSVGCGIMRVMEKKERRVSMQGKPNQGSGRK